MSFRFLSGVLFALCYAEVTTAQQDTLREIRIEDKKIHLIRQAIDSLSLQQHAGHTLNQLLEEHTQIFIRNYGPGGLSTLSIRGSSSAQTLVRWQGVTMNPALSGLVDLSTLPVNLFDDIQIAYGTETGQGIGGELRLSGTFKNDAPATRIVLNGSGNGIRNSQGYASIERCGKQLQWHLRLYNHQLNNQFTYFNPLRDSIQSMQHATSSLLGVLQDIYLKKKYHLFSAHLWWNQQKRFIPSAYFESVSGKSENSNALKTLLQWQYKTGLFSSVISTGLFSDRYEFRDSLSGFESRIPAIQIPFNAQLRFKLNPRWQIQWGTESSLNWLTQRDTARLLRSAWYVGIEQHLFNHRLRASGMIRQEWTNLFTASPAWHLSLENKSWKGWTTRLSIASNYRVPTLNELYFDPGGNSRLKPERGVSFEFLVQKKYESQYLDWMLQNTMYTKSVQDWIVWYGGAILTPHNINRVWSRGNETDLKIQFHLPNLFPGSRVRNGFAVIRILHQYQLTTTEEGNFSNDQSVGKQVPYIPRYQTRIHLGLQNNKAGIYAHWLYAGYRFVTTDESQWLSPYALTSVHAFYLLRSTHLQIRLQGAIQNLLNVRYEQIIGRPMPGRYVELGATFNWSK